MMPSFGLAYAARIKHNANPDRTWNLKSTFLISLNFCLTIFKTKIISVSFTRQTANPFQHKIKLILHPHL